MMMGRMMVIIMLVITSITMMMTVIVIIMILMAYSGNDNINSKTAVSVHNATASVCSNDYVNDVNLLNNNCQTSLHCLIVVVQVKI